MTPPRQSNRTLLADSHRQPEGSFPIRQQDRRDGSSNDHHARDAAAGWHRAQESASAKSARPRGIQRDWVERTGCWSSVTRVLLTYEQMRAYGLPATEGRCGDPRWPAFARRYGFDIEHPVQWEVEALGPDELQRLRAVSRISCGGRCQGSLWWHGAG